VPHRFVGPDREKLLNHVLWSNGHKTEEAAKMKEYTDKAYTLDEGKLKYC